MNPTPSKPESSPPMAQHSSVVGTWPTPVVSARPAQRPPSHKRANSREYAFDMIARIELENAEVELARRNKAADAVRAAKAEEQQRLWSRVEIVAVA